MKKLELAQRQIHLDFHTGQALPDVGADFNPREFARVMKRAHVNSVTVFAKCHHGHLYYATKHPARHPGLRQGLDLTRSQVDALHREGIRAPIYISVQCDEFAANTHPEWLVRTTEGALAHGRKPLSPGWQILDMSSPYRDYLYAQTEEILKRFKPVDGIFFDMCWDQPSVSNFALECMIARGYDPEKEGDRNRYAHDVALGYMRDLYRMVRRATPAATVYFNSRPLSNLAEEVPWLTHVEIEALPTGGWGYLYFPKNVRFARTFNRPYIGMTARFHKSWADFGGYKPHAALLYEVCQMLAHGAQCSIGDQMHPRGTLDSAAYDLIGRVYGYAERCEPWTKGASPQAEIGLFRAGAAAAYNDEPGGTNDGATRMLTQLKYQFDIVGPESDYERYRLLILPDSVVVDPVLVGRLRTFLGKGGALLFSGTSGLDSNLRPLMPQMGVTVAGMSPFQTTYIRPDPSFRGDIPAADHVLYERGLRVTAKPGATVLARIVEPYFDRTYRHFSSHFQTPPRPVASPYAAVVARGRVATIPFPVFKAFGTHGSLFYRQMVANVLQRLLPGRMITIDGPSTMEVTVMRQGRRTVVHCLSFAAEHRHTMDIVEDIVPLRDVLLTVRMAVAPRKVYLAPAGTPVPFTHARGRVTLIVPEIKGHQMVVLE